MEAGKEIVPSSIGGAVGGVLGFIFAGPVGAASAGAIGAVSGKILEDISKRFLSNREEVRVGAAALLAITKIKSRIEQGFDSRTDGFFEAKVGQRSNAEEIFEGVLLKSKTEHEEKKIIVISNIFANISFNVDFSVGEANHLLQLVDKFTYRQICLLAFLENKFDQLRGVDYANGSRVSYDAYSILLQIKELYDYGLISCRNDTDTDNVALLGVENICPNRLFLTNIGKRYCSIMGLSDIQRNDIKEVISFFGR